MGKKASKSPFISFFLIIEAIALAVSVFAGVFLGYTLKGKTRYEAEYADKLSFYEDSGFDLLVSGASAEQIQEFKTKDFVKNAVQASKISLNVKTNSVEDYREIFVFNSKEDMQYSEYTDERIIAQKDAEKYIYADYKFCSLYNVGLGDVITVTLNGTPQEYTISKVYRTNYLSAEGVLIATAEMLSVTDKAFCVYLTTDDKSALQAYLQDYKPLATLLPQMDGQTDEDYQDYLDEFYAKEYYSSYVTDLSNGKTDALNDYPQKIKSASTTFYIAAAVVSVVALLTSLGCFFINAKNKKDKIYKYIQENGGKRIFILYALFNVSFLVFMAAGGLIAMAASLKAITAYYTFALVLSTSYLALVLPIVFIGVGFLVTAFSIKKA